MAAFAAYLYANPETLKRYAFPSKYGPAPANATYGNRQPSRNSWLGVFGDQVDELGQISAETHREIKLTEHMVLLFNTAGQLSRGMPFVDGEYH